MKRKEAKISKTDANIVEVSSIEEVSITDRISQLEQVIIDDNAEIERRTANKLEAQTELDTYK